MAQHQHIPPLGFKCLTPFYDVLNGAVGLGKRLFRKVIVKAGVGERDIILDVGCGTGVLLSLVAQMYPSTQLVGVDPDSEALGIARRRFERKKLQANFLLALAESLPLPDESIDLYVSSLAFHHLSDEVKIKALREAYRVVRPGGKILIADFGRSRNIGVAKVLHLFKRVEYIEGNLRGLIPKTLNVVGFKNVETVGEHFPGIVVLKATKAEKGHTHLATST